MDIHIFDNKWRFDTDIDIEKYTNEMKTQIFLDFIKDMNIVSEGLRIIIRDINSDNNNDITHNVRVEDILLCLCLKINNMKEEDKSTYYKLINEQMDDMYHLGRCPIGRTARLYQIYKTI